MDNGRLQFASNTEHGRNHQHKPLGSRIACRQDTGVNCTIYNGNRAAFRLHLDKLDRLTENVLLAMGSPRVDMFSHRGRRRNRIDSGNFRKCVGRISRSFVTIHCFFIIIRTLSS